jgi:hypothetical protein
VEKRAANDFFDRRYTRGARAFKRAGGAETALLTVSEQA